MGALRRGVQTKSHGRCRTIIKEPLARFNCDLQKDLWTDAAIAVNLSSQTAAGRPPSLLFTPVDTDSGRSSRNVSLGNND